MRLDSSWKPLLYGPLRERASDALQAIVADLPSPSAAEIPAASLAGGKTGLAVLCAYLTLAGLDDCENAVQFLEQAIEAVSSDPIEPSLYSGFTGVAWATAHLQKQQIIADEEDPNIAVDEALRDYLSQSPWREDYDLVTGLVGFGVYALERLSRPTGVEILERVIDRLDETAERNSGRVTWLTSPELLPEWQRKLSPNGYYNLGLAHGVPGVIALLGRALTANVACAKARPLLEGAVEWLLAQQLLAGEAHSLFPAWVGSSTGTEDCRLAWCYGDAGIAAALLVASRSLGEPAWERKALEIAWQAAKRAPETTGVIDAGLCHGAAGLGHIFNRMYQAVGEAWLKEAAIFWFERTLEMRCPMEGIGGFYAVNMINGEKQREADPGLLTGAAGIALSLLAAITPVEPAWDQMLLVSIPNSSNNG